MPKYTIFAGVNGAGKTSIYKSIINLNDVIEMCYETNIYDNTEIFREIINFRNGKLIWKDKNIPSWAKNILEKNKRE